LDAAKGVEPVGSGGVQERIFAVGSGLGRERHPEVRRVGSQGGAEKSRWGDADDGEWRALDDERRADDGGIADEMLPPNAIAHDGDGWGAAEIVGGCEEAAGERAQAEEGEVVTGDELVDEGLGGAGSGA